MYTGPQFLSHGLAGDLQKLHSIDIKAMYPLQMTNFFQSSAHTPTDSMVMCSEKAMRPWINCQKRWLHVKAHSSGIFASMLWHFSARVAFVLSIDTCFRGFTCKWPGCSLCRV